MANLELEVPMKTDNVFEIGSMSKQFTAVSVMILVERGKINLDDEITKFIPDYPMMGEKITIHNLLTHTSGIKNFTSVKGLNAISKKDLSPVELIDFFKDEQMDFAPNEKFKYNNSGYIILGHIIELVSNKSYEDFVNINIFKKIGMLSSQYSSHRGVVKNRAYGYHNRNGFINKRYISHSLPYASGSLMSTVDDMLIWQNAIKNNLLLNKKTTDKIFTNYKLNNGDSINYGYGWNIKSTDNVNTREHGGSVFGFKSMAVYMVSDDIYVIGLNNCDCNSPTKITRDISRLVL